MIKNTKETQTTLDWVRNRSDELAIADGCYFDVENAAFVVWWIEYFLRLYEGENAGEPVLLRSGLKEVDPDFSLWDEDDNELLDWDEGGKEQAIYRAELYSRLRAEKLEADSDWQPDWQYECTMRLFGWMVPSEKWGRDIRRFNSASIWIPKKSKKTPTLAAWSLYMTCGDGEQGAKTFAGAKDGNQASIAMEHAMNMVEQSPILSAECKLNKNEKSIYHIPTRSKYKPLSSNDSRHQEAKEGLNGNMAVDETHVVDAKFIKRTRRMGISRAEPMHLEVSTAGTNPDGYGKQRQDYARKVFSGESQNNKLFVAIYEAPQDLTVEELKADPIKFGKLANPAWGHTVYQEEFVNDFNESVQSIAALNDFMLYRLNIWTGSAAQWLDLQAWSSAAEPFELEDFEGFDCAIGGDFSRTRDMSALTVSIKESEERTRQKTFMWITEAYVKKHGHKAAFAEWAASGELIIVEGETIKFSQIRDKFKEIESILNVGIFVFDKTYATEFSQWVEEEFGILVLEFPQSASAMENPIDGYQADLIEGKIKHDGNSCLTWQAGHAETKPNHKGARILAKPDLQDSKKIDGIVSSVMSYWGVPHVEAGYSGPLFLG